MRRESKGEDLLSFILEPKCSYFSLLGIQYQILQIALLAEGSTEVLQVIRALKVITLEEAVGCIGALGAVSNLVVVEVDDLQSHDSVVFVDPDVDADDQRFGFGVEVPAVVESSLSPDRPALLLHSGQSAAPLLGLRLLAADDHPALADLPPNGGLALHLALAGFLLKLDDHLGPGWFGDVGDEMLDIELILVELLLDLPLDLIHAAVVLTLQFSALVVVVGVVAEQGLLGGLEDLPYLAQPQLQGLDDAVAVFDVLLYDRLLVDALVLLEDQAVDLLVVVLVLGLQPVQLLQHLRVVLGCDPGCCVFGVLDDNSTRDGLLLLVQLLLEFWKVVSVHFPPFLLHLKQVRLLLLVVDISLPLLLLDLLQSVLDLLHFLLGGGHASDQIIVDVLPDDLILYFGHLLQALYLFDELIDLRIDGRNCVLQSFDPVIASVFFFLALKGGYGALVHLYLLVSVLQLSF